MPPGNIGFVAVTQGSVWRRGSREPLLLGHCSSPLVVLAASSNRGFSAPRYTTPLRQGLVASDEERLARFEREAKLLAWLNNANIAAIYGLEEDNGARFLVLELVEGDTLADRRAAAARPRPRWRATRI